MTRMRYLRPQFGDNPGEVESADGWVLLAMILTAVAVFMVRAGVDVIHNDISSAYGKTNVFHSFIWLALAIACFHIAKRPEKGLSSTLVGGVVLTLAGAVVAFAAFGAYASASKSSDTQTSGILETVRAPNTGDYIHCSDCSNSFTVALHRPVAGHAVTAVYLPDLSPYPGGQPVSVRVDPKDPGYAELAGRPYATDVEAGGTVAFACVALALGLTGIVRGTRLRVRRRSRRTAQVNESLLQAATGGQYLRRAWAPVVLWGIAALFLVSIADSTLFAGTGGSFSGAMIRGQNVFMTCVWFAGTGVCFLLAVHYERRARRLLASPALGSTSACRSPVSTLAGGIALLLLGVGFAFTAFSAQAWASRSSYTQAHGVPEEVTVTSVTSDGGCFGHSCAYRSFAAARLGQPVSGRTRTIVNMPEDPASDGTVTEAKKYAGRLVIQARVDPQDPGYAELQYSPYRSEGAAKSMDVIATLALVLGGTGTVRGLRYFRKSRRAAAVWSGASSGR